MIVSHVLSALLSRCAPRVGLVTISSIVAYESGAQPYAIGDNTDRHSYFPATRAEAESIARSLLLEGHDLDLGLAQINVSNLRAWRYSLRDAFDPCANAALGARLLEDDYRVARKTFEPQAALMHALSAYNTGGYWAGMGYANGVYATALSLRFEVPARTAAR